MIVFDTETTGIIKSVDLPSNSQPRIIELFAQRLDANLEVIGRLHLMINPQEPLTEEIIRITSITEKDLRGTVPFPMHVRALQRFWLGAELVIGHNVTFDLDMLFTELRRVSLERKFPWTPLQLCTVEATESLQGRRLSLSNLHEHLFGEKFDNAHRAESDVLATVRCLQRLVEDGTVKLPTLGG